MKKQIRQGVFETNSSSTHSICIAKDVELIIPKGLHFEFGEFGWNFDTLKSINQKASYLYTGLIVNDRQKDFNKIVEVLKKKDVIATYESIDDRTIWDCGYIDHSDKLTNFLNVICEDEEKLMRFLFSPMSFILTGNDNGDTDVNIKVSYAYDGYYKGN